MKHKPFWGVDITHNKKNQKLNGDVFIVARASLSQSAALDDAVKSASDIEQTAKLPIFLRVIQYICGIGGAICFAGLIRGLAKNRDLTFVQAYENAPWAIWCAVIGLSVWGILSLAAKKKAGKIAATSENQQAMAELENAVGDIYAEFNVPADALEIDLLSFGYKIKNGEPVQKTRPFEMTSHINMHTRIFVEEGNLIIADRECKYAFPLDSLRGIHTVKKRISIPQWYKDTPFNEGEYKKYKMAANQFGSIFFKPYHILELDRNGVTWGIYFPCYELPVIEKLTGLTAKEK